MASLLQLILSGLGAAPPAAAKSAASSSGGAVRPSLRVIGAGVGRTGTDSLRRALDVLGLGPTYHMLELLGVGRSVARPVPLLESLGFVSGHNEKWVEAERDVALGRPPDFAFLYEHYRSAVDAPASSFWPQLLEANPEAKVVLTVRDPAEWYRSINRAWCRLYGGGSAMDKLIRIPKHVRPYGRRHNRMQGALDRATGRTVGWDDFSIRRICEDEAYAVAFLEAWNEKVRRTVPEDRLLVFETGRDGWSELAAFLDVPEPDGPYPHSNSAEEFIFVIQMHRAASALTVCLLCLLGGLVYMCRTRRGGATKRKRS